jgi:hypothetical protein
MIYLSKVQTVRLNFQVGTTCTTCYADRERPDSVGMSLWQQARWNQRPNQPGPTSSPSRPSLSGNSSAAASTVSLMSSNSGNAPRRPLNPLNLMQERRSNSIPAPVKSDHNPVRTLIGILGELPDGQDPLSSGLTEVVPVEKKVDVGGKTLEEWLEELEKDKSSRLSKEMDQRIPSLTTNAENTALSQYKELQTSISVSSLFQLI